jgi:hypothetical protein
MRLGASRAIKYDTTQHEVVTRAKRGVWSLREVRSFAALRVTVFGSNKLALSMHRACSESVCFIPFHP